jgi:hypothetical protein
MEAGEVLVFAEDVASTSSENELDDEPKASPPITDAGPPFDSPKADVILRSTDNVDFRTFKSLLSMASPVFETTFTLPQPSDKVIDEELKDGLVVIPVGEQMSLLKKLLLLCQPGWAPELGDVTEIREVLTAAMKYEMEGVTKRALSMVAGLMEQDPKLPLISYAISVNYGWKEEAKLAARRTLRFPETQFPLIEEMQLITGLQYQGLLRYHRMCGEAAKALALPMVHMYGWIPETIRRFDWFTTLQGHRTHRIPDPFKKPDVIHHQCEPASETIMIGGLAGGIKPRGWWMDYMKGAAADLAIRPCGSTVMSESLMDVALEQATRCETCRIGIFGQMRLFSGLFAAEINKAVSQVELVEH